MKGERYYSNGFVRVYFHGKYAFVLLVYRGLYVVVAPNDDAKIRRWECGLRIWTKIFYIFFLRELSYN